MKTEHRLLNENGTRTLLGIHPCTTGLPHVQLALFGPRIGTLAAARNLTESLETNDPLAVLAELSRSFPGRLAGSVIHDLRFFWRDYLQDDQAIARCIQCHRPAAGHFDLDMPVCIEGIMSGIRSAVQRQTECLCRNHLSDRADEMAVRCEFASWVERFKLRHSAIYRRNLGWEPDPTIHCYFASCCVATSKDTS